MIPRSLFRVYVCLALALAVSVPAFAQGANASISGTVVDNSGGAIPGANVVVKGESGVSFEAISNGEGLFTVPSVAPGVYTVTISLSGFKTAVLKDVRVAAGTPASLKAVLEVGQLTETVTVAASSELINTQTATVSSTLNSDQLLRMPTPTRNALNAVTFLPGINTATTNRESRINGLPESFVSITLDGVSNNDNFLRSSDSFFASVTPRQDAVEAVNVTTAVQGAQTGGSGAVSINFSTRSGTNRLNGSAYEYWRDPQLNSNYWFNKRNGLPKNAVKLNQYGARLGGPIVIPGIYDGHNKAFFFTNYEQIRFPNNFTRTRVTLHPRAAEGWFRYTVSGQTREVNVLQLAAANGQLAATDPTVMATLARINAAAQSQGTLNPTSDPMLNQYVWQSPGRLFEHQPTSRIDYNLTDRHRLSGSYAIIWAERDPDYLNGVDSRFPGGPNYRFFRSRRPLHSYTLRSTLAGNRVNEIKVGITAKGGASKFGFPTDPSGNPESFADTGGFALNFPDFDNDNVLTNWHATNGPSWRSAPTYSIDESLTWLKGKHSFNFGVAFLRATAWEMAQQIVPGIDFGFSTTLDPAAGLFNSTNFPNASTGQLSDARDLYAMLTGRVSAVTGQAALDPKTNKYVFLGPRRREGKIDLYSGFAQDSWRLSPTLTLTGGLRYDVQLPFSAGNSTMTSVSMADMCGISGLGDGGRYSRCNFFQPGVTSGQPPAFRQLTEGTLGYKTDWNNLAPSVSVAWRPNQQSGFWRTLLGDPEQATLRGGYTLSYERQGMGIFTGVYGSNQGSTINLARNENLGNLAPAGQWPVLFSQRERLSPQTFREDPTFPIAVRAARADDMAGFAPDLEIASAGTWTIGFQRSITRDMAFEVRYVGTRGWNQWSELNYNAVRGEVLQKNGFLNEFRNAMANLRANNAAGGNRVGSFAYFGPGTGTSPLPVYLAYLNGSRDFGNPSAYSGTNWTNTTFAGRMAAVPNPVASAETDLDGNATRRANAIAAGIPANYFVPNPDVDDVDVTDSGAFSDYHAFQFELRRRLSKGLSANVNYQYAIERGSAFDGFSFGREMADQGNVRHAIKTQWDWTVPVGRGQRFGNNLPPLLQGIVGGWRFNGVGRIQARTLDFGNVRLIGMTEKDLQKMYKFDIRVDPETGLRTVYMLPDDVIVNTRRAYSTSSTSLNGYSTSLGAPEGRYIAPANSADCIQVRAGDCASRNLLIRAPFFTRFDLGVAKEFPIKGRSNFQIQIDVLNVFDNINFNPVANPGTGATIFQVTSAYTDLSNTYDPGGRLGQIMFRINW
ncbi:MAG TPA: carboxypeptidase regulatory-like domain-containing protein [Vicinamibacterales bacterium]|nr:carboxypeptidase regulatory-like domain-containing protein [Vicinamibacterales bacterium]